MYYHNSAQTSHFLSKEIWDQAVKLLEYQINQKKKNKHYNTLSMHYYESVLPDTSCLKTDDYFNEKIGTDLFYGLEKEFKIFSYLLPKPGLGLRSYTFFSYPLRVLYYAIGLYLVKITQEYIDDFRPKYKNIRSYYGGNLRFNKDDIVLNYNSTQYKKSYKQFRYHVRKEALENPDHRVVLRLDIKDYFDEISIPSLLNNISRRIKTSTSSSYNFDPTTHDAITFFFRYLTNNRDGIPQSEHDLIGGFIGYLYLVFADFLFHDEIAREYGLLKDHKIIRYVDDIYIFIEFDSNVKQAEREGFIDSLSARIADILHYKLNLKLNTKSRLYWLNNEDDLDELLRNLKKVSGSYYMPSDEDEEEFTAVEKAMRIIEEIKKIKLSKMGAYFVLESSIEDDLLKEVYEKPVDQILNSNMLMHLIEKTFQNFNFNLVKVSPAELTSVIFHNTKVKDEYRSFLLNKKYLPTDDVDLILKFLAQSGFADTELLEKLKQNKYMKDIVSLVNSRIIDIDNHGYFSVDKSKLLFISLHPHVLEQIKLRVFAQKNENYSVALNHLLNEIHAICLLKDSSTARNSKDYKAGDVRDFLISAGVDSDTCTDIYNLFDRRNINQISHPGSTSNDTYAVKADEYAEYFESVGKCLNQIL